MNSVRSGRYPNPTSSLRAGERSQCGGRHTLSRTQPPGLAPLAPLSPVKPGGLLRCAARSRRLPSLGLGHSVHLGASPPSPGNPAKRAPQPPEAKGEIWQETWKGRGSPCPHPWAPVGGTRNPRPQGSGVVTARQAHPGPAATLALPSHALPWASTCVHSPPRLPLRSRALLWLVSHFLFPLRVRKSLFLTCHYLPRSQSGLELERMEPRSPILKAARASPLSKFGPESTRLGERPSGPQSP